MITVDNLKRALLSMGFSENGSLFEKRFPAYNCSLAVDFTRAKLVYPEAIKGRDRNDGFDAPENFVVFECVNRLLDKGYRPEDIDLEKEKNSTTKKDEKAQTFVYRTMVRCFLSLNVRLRGVNLIKPTKIP